MAQWVEKSLQTLEVKGLKPGIGNIIITEYNILYWNDENKEQEARNNGRFKKRVYLGCGQIF